MNQLAIANESLGGGTVVVMAERDKEEMELDIAKMEFDFRGTSVIGRSGSPLILADLKKVCIIFCFQTFIMSSKTKHLLCHPKPFFPFLPLY